MIESLYVIGSLRNGEIPEVGSFFRREGIDVFDDWYSAGPDADDRWRDYEKSRGRTYREALDGYAAKNVFAFDHRHLERCDSVLLVLPAGRSGHLELGYAIGRGKRGFVLFPEVNQQKVADGWEWLAGLYEGEGSFGLTNRKKSNRGVNLSISMTDHDVLEKACRIAGVGKVYGPYERSNPNWSPIYRWQVTNMRDCLYVLNGIQPFLMSRRQGQLEMKVQELGVTEEERLSAGYPHESRWDVMYQFAEKVFLSKEEALEYFRPENEVRRKPEVRSDDGTTEARAARWGPSWFHPSLRAFRGN